MPGLARFARPAEWAFACVTLLWLGGANGPWRQFAKDGGLKYVLLGISLLLLVQRRRELRALLAVSWPLLLPVLLAALSPAWSLDAQLSLRTSVALEAFTCFGLWLALRFDLAEQHLLVSFTLALIIAGSALAALLAPSVGVMDAVHPGAWQGLLRHKNALGRVLGLGVLACGLLALAHPRARAWAGGVAALALAMFLPTRSVGGVAALALAALPVGFVAALRRLVPAARRRTTGLVGVALAALGALAVAFAPTWLAWLGRDVTLTRRTEIWALVLPAIAERPWLGHGASAFWDVAAASSEIDRTLHFDPGSAHNGFLDLALDLGVVGLAAFCIPFALALARAVRLALRAPGAAALWPLAFLAWLVTSNLAEGAMLRRGPFGWAVFVATAAALAARTARARA
jgi:exopolysaccharide production protein ExoQ